MNGVRSAVRNLLTALTPPAEAAVLDRLPRATPAGEALTQIADAALLRRIASDVVDGEPILCVDFMPTWVDYAAHQGHDLLTSPWRRRQHVIKLRVPAPDLDPAIGQQLMDWLMSDTPLQVRATAHVVAGIPVMTHSATLTGPERTLQLKADRTHRIVG